MNLETYEIILGITLIFLALAFKRISLSFAKHPSLAGHSKMSRRVSKLVPFYEFKNRDFFSSDKAPEIVVIARQKGFEALSDHYKKYFKKTYQMASEAQESISDMQFTRTYRVPFQYSNYVNNHLQYGNFVKASSSVTLTDIDGNIMYDLGGSYGVNVFGNDFYKICIEKGSDLVKDLGPVLGPYHPLIINNVKRIKEISGMDEVSFHMSGTEAVMQAVRLARYHTKRSHLVKFCGAYHGWWWMYNLGLAILPLQTIPIR
jgi:glutamate-1-semialdehyde 2,1-aminomutase